MSLLKPGDKCLVLLPPPGAKTDSWAKPFVGTIVTLKKYVSENADWPGNKHKHWWLTEEAGDIIFAECVLQKLPPPKREDLALGSWDLCPWHPEKLDVDRLEAITQEIGK